MLTDEDGLVIKVNLLVSFELYAFLVLIVSNVSLCSSAGLTTETLPSPAAPCGNLTCTLQVPTKTLKHKTKVASYNKTKKIIKKKKQETKGKKIYTQSISTTVNSTFLSNTESSLATEVSFTEVFYNITEQGTEVTYNFTDNPLQSPPQPQAVSSTDMFKFNNTTEVLGEESCAGCVTVSTEDVKGGTEVESEPLQQHSSLSPVEITGISIASVVGVGIFIGIIVLGINHYRGAMNFQFKRDNLSVRSGDRSTYLDDSFTASTNADFSKDTGDEMLSLDNDSFLNSLESMSCNNFWEDSITSAVSQSKL